MPTLAKDIECTGCEACRSICPVNAISMQPNGEMKAELPVVDYDKCIDCHACEKACPVINPVELKDLSKAYAAIAKDPVSNETSASGGAGAEIAAICIRKGGTVYGAVSEGRDIFHLRCTTLADINRIRGSKYVKSKLLDTYKSVRKDLKDGLPVTFFGTPCQVAGLKKFLKSDPENLLTVDIICHGTPPQELLKEHLDKIVGDKNVTKIAFREEGYHFRIYNKDKILYDNNLWKELFRDEYYTSFYLTSSLFRDSCYSCRYAAPQRCSDITIGDFWGLSKDVKFSREPTGISVIMPLTQKGDRIVAELADRMEMIERPVSEAVKGNAQLKHHSVLSRQSRLLRKLYHEGYSLKRALRTAFFPQFIAYSLKCRLKK